MTQERLVKKMCDIIHVTHPASQSSDSRLVTTVSKSVYGYVFEQSQGFSLTWLVFWRPTRIVKRVALITDLKNRSCVH